MNPGEIICRMGTWDYATAGYIISSLPADARNALGRVSHSTLQMLLYLCGLRARKSGRQALYCTPGQAYLANGADCSTRTIRRALAALADLGLVQHHRRKPLAGNPQTNLYQLGGQLLALLHNIKWPKTLMKSHKDKNGRQRPKERLRRPTQSVTGVLEEWRDSHKPADLSSLPVPGGGDRLDEEKFKAGMDLIKRAIAEKLGKR